MIRFGAEDQDRPALILEMEGQVPQPILFAALEPDDDVVAHLIQRRRIRIDAKQLYVISGLHGDRVVGPHRDLSNASIHAGCANSDCHFETPPAVTDARPIQLLLFGAILIA